MVSTTSQPKPVLAQPVIRKKPFSWGKVTLFVALTLIALFMILPFIWQAVSSLKPLWAIDGDFWMKNAKDWQPRNYLRVFEMIPFGRYYLNSVLVAVWVTLLQVFTSALAAYAFSRIKWPGRDKVFLMYLATMMIPGVVLMVPQFWLILQMHLFNSYAGLIIPAAFSAFGTFLLRQFMLGLPTSLDEAAEIDGANEWQVFTEVILPLARPGLIVLAIFTFFGAYQAFFWPLIIIQSEHLRTLPIGMLSFDSVYGQETNTLMAAAVMSIVPLIVLFITFQRYLVKGIQLGAVKG